MSKNLASEWLMLADRLSRLNDPCKAKNIAICLASAYRQGWAASRKEEVEESKWQPEATAPVNTAVDTPLDQVYPMKLENKKGADMSEWPEDLRVREVAE